MAKLDLRSARILILRAQRQAEETAEAIEQAGGRPIVAPVIQQVALPFEVINPSDFDRVLFTSANGVLFFFDQVSPDSFKTTKIGAVGTVTADALTRFGLQPYLLPKRYAGLELAKALGDISNQRILIPRSKIGRKEIISRLESAGAIVTDLPVYTTIEASLSDETIAEISNGVDAILFTSPSTVNSFWAQAPRLSGYGSALVCSIGPSTTAALSALGRSPDIIAETSTLTGLLDALSTSIQSIRRLA